MMLRIDKKVSTVISLVISVICFGGIVWLYFMLPMWIEYFYALPDFDGVRGELTGWIRLFVYGVSYAILIFSTAGDLSLFFLLIKVLKHQVFTPQAVALVRIISWCLMLMGLSFIALGKFFTIAPAMGLIVLFVGLSVRVVKNVIEEAVSIKEENDYTV